MPLPQPAHVGTPTTGMNPAGDQPQIAASATTFDATQRPATALPPPLIEKQTSCSIGVSSVTRTEDHLLYSASATTPLPQAESTAAAVPAPSLVDAESQTVVAAAMSEQPEKADSPPAHSETISSITTASLRADAGSQTAIDDDNKSVVSSSSPKPQTPPSRLTVQVPTSHLSTPHGDADERVTRVASPVAPPSLGEQSVLNGLITQVRIIVHDSSFVGFSPLI